MVIPLIVSIIFFVLVIYLLSWLFTNNTTLSAYSDATVATVIPATSVPDTTSVNYSFSIWVYISDWSVNYSRAKVLFSRDGAKPMVKLGGTDNTLTTTIQMTDGTNAECTVPNIPIQKWTNILISVNNKAVDTYLNGKLVKTCILDKVPMAATAANGAVNLTPNGGFAGFTARFKYWADSINPQEAWNVYKAGPGGNFLTNFFGLYKIQLNFLKGAETKASITI
jgi:hypothetical protein